MKKRTPKLWRKSGANVEGAGPLRYSGAFAATTQYGLHDHLTSAPCLCLKMPKGPEGLLSLCSADPLPTALIPDLTEIFQQA